MIATPSFMSMLRVIWVMLFVMPMLHALEVGFQEITDDGKPGQPFTQVISRATLDYTTNDNRISLLTLYSKAPFSRDRFFLVRKDKKSQDGESTFYFNAAGSWPPEDEYSVTTYGSDEAGIEELIRRFQPTVRKRKHPGHRMLVTLATSQSEYSADEPIIVTLKITNVGVSSFTFQRGGKQRGSRDNQFAFTMLEVGKDMVPDTGSHRHMGGLSNDVTLGPGESVEIPVDLKKWFVFKPGGSYSVFGSYSMQLVDPGNPSAIRRILWDDYACATTWIIMKK